MIVNSKLIIPLLFTWSYTLATPPKKTSINLGLPYVNQIYLNSINQKVNSVGFNGESLSLERSTKTNTSFLIGFYFLGNSNKPFPFKSEQKKAFMTFLYLTKNKLITDKIQFGYGANYSFNTIVKEGNLKNTTNKSIGLMFNSYYKLTNHFNLGLVYKNNIFKINSDNLFEYGHSISIEALWKLTLKKH